MWRDREQSALAPKRSARSVSDLVNSKLYGRAYQIYIKLDFHKNPIWRVLSNLVTYRYGCLPSVVDSAYDQQNIIPANLGSDEVQLALYTIVS